MDYWVPTGEVIQGNIPEERPFDAGLNTEHPVGTVGAWKHPHGHWMILHVGNGYWDSGVWCFNSQIMTRADFDEKDVIILETPND